jgi:hypothetical protein
MAGALPHAASRDGHLNIPVQQRGCSDRYRESEAAGEGGAQLRDVASPAFVPLPMPAQPSLPTPAPAPEQTAVRVEVEIHRNGTTVRASLPLDSSSAAWLREVTA